MWAGSLAVRSGDVVVGVRVDDAALLAALGDLYADSLADVADPPAYLSVQLGREEGVGLLFEGSCRVLRAREPARLVDGLAGHLRDLGDGAARGGAVRIVAAVVVAGDDAVLLPSDARPALDAARSALARAGATPLDTPTCEVDPASGELIVDPALPADAVRACLARHGLSADDGAVAAPAGRYRLRAVADGGATPCSAAVRTARLAEQIAGDGLTGSERLHAAARLVARVPQGPAPASGDAAALVAAVVAARRVR